MFKSTKTLFVAATVAIAAIATGAAADTYPSKPITFVVPWNPGGRTDIVGRLVAEVMSGQIGQPIAVVNKTGGRGAVGTKYVLDAPKDGYTVLVTTPGNQILGPVHRDVGFVPMDFRGIGRVAAGSVILAANKEQPFTDAQSLIAYAKANPGKVTVSGVKNVLPYMTAMAFANKAGITFKHIPAKGDAGAVPMALGGHVNLVASSSLNAVASHLDAGTMVAVVAFSEERLPEIPDTPTAIDLGFDVTGSPWTGIAVAKGVPEDIIAKLRAALKVVVADASFVERASKSKTTVSYLDGPGFEKQWEREFNNFKAVVGK